MTDKEYSLIEKMRHTGAHVLAAALIKYLEKEKVEVKLAIGPPIDNGFYYDFDLGDRRLSEDDFKDIEKIMYQIVNKDLSFERREASIKEAKKISKGQPYKLELLKDFAAAGAEEVTYYKIGDFEDLCRGNHVESTGKIGAFKIDKIAGAYWRGDEKNAQLQRVYVLMYETQEELDNYLKMRQEAEKRDHRKLGQEMELFMIDDMVGKGLVMWLPNGTILRNQIEILAIEIEEKAGFQRVVTPHLAKEELFLTSGHLPYYKDSMYPPMVMDDGTYYLKAMNCPHHHLIYRHRPRSYRELPLRLAEYGTVYRNELSGTLAGLLRVRALAMNDAHIYCRKDQIEQEFSAVLDMTMEYFKIFGLNDYWFRLSKWDPKHIDKYVNEPQNWEYSEGIIRKVLETKKVKFIEVDDEAAFYGPKVDIQFKSVVGREETMSTVQLDFVAKTRFKLEYTDETGQANNEVFVIHRAPLSTHERFTAFVIEHFGGNFPAWLAPEQVRILPISDKFMDYAKKVEDDLKSAGIRVSVDSRAESIGKKIRETEKQKVPYSLIVGEKEVEAGTVAVRKRHDGDKGAISVEEFLSQLVEEIRSRE